MKKSEYPNWIDPFAKAVYELGKSHDAGSHLPFNGINFYPLFDYLWIDKVYQAIAAFRSSGMEITDIINDLPGHSALKFKLLEIIISLKTSQTEPEKARMIVDFFIDAIRERAISENFWDNSLIKEYQNVKEIIAQKKMAAAQIPQAREVAKIIAGCGTLVHGLYNDFHTDYSYDVLGPYDVSEICMENSSLFVRQFPDLKPVEVWPEFENFPFKKIMVYAIYRNMESETRYIGCHMIYKQNLVDNLTHFQLELDGRFVNSEVELKKIRETVFEWSSSHYMKYKELDFEEQKAKWLWQLCYVFKPFFEKMNLPWQPTEEMLKTVAGKDLSDYMSDYDLSFSEYSEKIGIECLKRIYTK